MILHGRTLIKVNIYNIYSDESHFAIILKLMHYLKMKPVPIVDSMVHCQPITLHALGRTNWQAVRSYPCACIAGGVYPNDPSLTFTMN